MTGSLQDFIDSIFERFDAAIEQHNVKLPFRAEDFMLMDTEPNRGQYSFKHYDTRNYVFMTTAGRIIVPRVAGRCGGFFGLTAADDKGGDGGE